MRALALTLVTRIPAPDYAEQGPERPNPVTYDTRLL